MRWWTAPLLCAGLVGALVAPSAAWAQYTDTPTPSPYDEEAPAEGASDEYAGEDAGADGEYQEYYGEGDEAGEEYAGEYEDDYEDDYEDEEWFEPHPALQEYVSVATKFTFPVQRTPATVSVVTRRQIERAGFRSVGEALATVPGLFVSYDLQNYHVGVRGLFGGARSGSRLLRIMIDSRPVAFVQSGTYLLGEEFIPMSAVERIEIMRGPASALYGAGALTGAINIVTRRASFAGETEIDGDVSAFGGFLGQTAIGGDASLSVTGETWYGVLAAAGGYQDRSGLEIPEESPFRDDIRNQRRTIETGGDNTDRAAPRSFFGRAETNLGGGRLGAMVLAQFSDRDAEFADLTVLSDGSRLNVFNLNASLFYERPFASGLFIRGLLGYAEGGEATGDQFVFPDQPYPEDVGQRLELITRDFSSSEITGLTEVLWEFSEGGLILFGLDGQYDRENLSQTSIQRLEMGGALTVNAKPPTETLYNLGLYSQLLYPIISQLTVAAGVRYDYNNVIDSAISARVAAVYTPTQQLSVKLMLGRAFKAPSPEQLYARPLTLGLDVEGDPELSPQFLQSAEATLDYFPVESLRLSASFFFNLTNDAIAYVIRGDQLEPTPFDAQSVGGELLVRHAMTLDSGIETDLAFTMSIADTTTDQTNFGGLLQKVVPDNETYPQFMIGTFANVSMPDTKLNFYLSYRWVGERVPSQTNIRQEGSGDNNDPGYLLDPYHMLDASVNYGPIDFGDAASMNLQVSGTNLLGSTFSEIGFTGVDVPAIGRTVWARVRLNF